MKDPANENFVVPIDGSFSEDSESESNETSSRNGKTHGFAISKESQFPDVEELLGASFLDHLVN
jgi:hypothetical protein